MPKTLADGRLKLTALVTAPADPKAVTAEELNAGTDIQCRILKSDYRLSAAASDTVDDTELCNSSNATVFGRDNFEGTLTPFRYLDAAGAADSINDVAWDLLKEKGADIWLAEREGPEHDEDWADGDEYSLFEVITDNAQAPADRTGYVKRTVPLGVQQGFLNYTVGGDES